LIKSGFGYAEVFVVVTVPKIEFRVGEGFHDGSAGERRKELGEVEIHRVALYEPPVVAGKVLFLAHLADETFALAPADDDRAGIFAHEGAFAGGEWEVQFGGGGVDRIFLR